MNNEPVNVKFVQHPHHQQQVSPLSANQAKIQYIQNLHPGQLENYYVLANSPSRNHQPINNQPQIRAHSQPITKKKK